MNPRRCNQNVKQIFVFSLVTAALVIFNILNIMITGKHVLSGVNALDAKSQDYIGEEVLPANRGIIYDRSKDILAQDIETHEIYAIISETRVGPNNEPEYVDDFEKAAQILAPYLDMSKKEIIDVFQYGKNNNLYQVSFGNKGKNLSLATKEAIEAEGLKGIEFNRTTKRHYNYGQFASYLLGFTNYDDVEKVLRGQGLEYTMNDTLTGTDGLEKYQKNSYGNKLAGSVHVEKTPVQGNNVVLTIDKKVQETLENTLQRTLDEFNAEKAWGIIMEVETGKILGYASYPSFDLNNINISDYTDLNAQFLFEPGSVMKGITYAAAIDSGVYPEGETYRAGRFYFGYDQDNDKIYRVGEGESTVYPPIQDALGNDFNTLTFDDGFLRSSNIAICELLANYLKPSLFESYLYKFGFGDQAVDIPYVSNLPGSFIFEHPSSKLNVGFGQGINVTALQMCQAYTAIFNDGKMMRPYIVDRIENPYDNSIVDKTEPLVVANPISAEASAKVRELMYGVVEEEIGTAHYRYKMDGVDLIAKTGTGEIVDGDKGYRTDLYTNSVMTAAPYDDPKVMMYYVFQSKDILNFSGEPFKDAFKEALIAANVTTNGTTESSSKEFDTWESYTMPSLVNHSLVYTETKVEDYNVDKIIIGDGKGIVRQYPKAGNTIHSNQLLFLLTDGSTYTMPNMVGWTRKDVATFSELTKIPIYIEGNGKVKEQNVDEGQIISQEMQISVTLE